MAQSNQEQIVQRMIDAGEPEENIALVIKSFKDTKPKLEATSDITPEQNAAIENDMRGGPFEIKPEPGVKKKPASESVFKGSYGTISEAAKPVKETTPEPDTYWGGFRKGISDYLGEITSGIMPGLESAAQPKTTGDFLNLIVPSELPHIARGNLGKIGSRIAEEPKPKFEPLPINESESISDYIRRNGIESIDTTTEEALANRAKITTQPRPSGPWDTNVDVSTKSLVKKPEDVVYDLAREKFGMGKDNPDLNPFSKEALDKLPSAKSPEVSAEFLGLQENGEPLFNVKGGANDKSTVGLDKLKELGIEAPEIPKDAKPVRGEDLQRKAMQERRSSAMDARNKGFQGTVSDESVLASSADNMTPNEIANLPKEDAPKVAQLAKTNQVAKMANESQKKSLWGEVRDANRALLTSFDFSALSRQGAPLRLTKAYWTSIDDMFKAWGSERAYKNIIESIYQHPNFVKTATGEPSLAERAGLDLSGAEQFQSSVAERLVPGVRASERAYNGFLNKLRADHFNTLVDTYKNSGIDLSKNDVKLKLLGEFINDATGKGSLGKLEKMAPILNEAFFAPKLMASRVNMYKRWLDPRTYGNADPIMRKQAIKSLLSTIGFGMTIGELGRLAGAQVSNDPRSADFRKIKIGNTRIDPFSGHQQYAVGASKFLSGQSTSSQTNKFGQNKTSGLGVDQPLAMLGLTPQYKSGGFGQPTRASVTGQFFQNKLAPVPSLVWSWMEGTDWDGQPFELKKALLDRTVPIVMQDLYELYKEDPKLLPLGVLPVMGEGLQTYGR